MRGDDQVQPGLVLLADVVVDVDQRRRVRRRSRISICSVRLEDAAEQLAGRRPVQHDAERVVAVGRERVLDGEAAARAPRRALDVHASATACAEPCRSLRSALAVSDRRAPTLEIFAAARK